MRKDNTNMSNVSNTPWPEGCQGAVSLTFDDGLSSQLERAVPILNDHGLRGTFYVCPRGENWEKVLEPWREVAKAGHEVGNHSLSHTCSCNMSGNPKKGLESMTLDDMETDILEAERRLREAIPEQEARTFCYPCYQAYVGRGPTRQSYVPVIARHFPAGRGLGEAPNHPLTADLHYLFSWSAERRWGADLVGLCERAASLERWTILTFHGIHQGHLSVADVDFQELCGFLSKNRDRLLVAPVVEIAQRISKWRKMVSKNKE